MLRSTSRFLVATAILALAAPAAHSAVIAAGDLIVTATGPCCGSSSTLPDVYQLDQTGGFKGFFYSPFQSNDIAVNKSGNILFASSSSGTIVETDTTGAFQGFIATPVPSITGLGIAPNGNIIAADGNNIYQLDSTGKFLNLTFSSTPISSSVGVDPQGDLLYPISQCCSNASIGVLNLTTRTVSVISTGLSSISSLSVDESGNIWAIGSRNFAPCFAGGCNIFELDTSGDVLSQIVGPEGASGIAVANLPEPSTLLLAAVGLAGLAVRKYRTSA